MNESINYLSNRVINLFLAKPSTPNGEPDRRLEGRDKAVGLARGLVRYETSDRERTSPEKAPLSQQLQHGSGVSQEQKG